MHNPLTDQICSTIFCVYNYKLYKYLYIYIHEFLSLTLYNYWKETNTRMSRIAADNISEVPDGSQFSDGREMVDHSGEGGASPTLGELLEYYVGDIRREITGDSTTAVHHQVLEMSSTNIEQTRSVPFVLSFRNLNYSVKVSRKISLPAVFKNNNCLASANPPVGGENGNLFSKTKVLLKDISGEARDGEILAVLGASGSGKSTLIDALANRIAKGSLKGTITLNGENLDSKLIKVISAYVMQDDLLFPMLTVEETLMFAAEFRLPRTLSKSKKKLRVHALIGQLGLKGASNTIIGDEGHRGVSGGERRRVSIGIDIIHDPIILFLDEPTSGLDSTSAYMVVKVLQRIARSGSIVIMSIHQPSYRIVGLLDRLLFLSRGQAVYSGSPTNLPLYFADFGHPIPEKENRTEFALDLIRELEVSPNGTKSLVEFNQSWVHMKRSRQINATTPLQTSDDHNLFGNLSLKEAITASISKGKLVSGGGTTSTSSISMVPTFANPLWAELAVLSRRSLINSRRMPELFVIRSAAIIITGFFLATIFWQLDNSPKGIQERLGFFAFAMTATFYFCTDALPVFLHHRFIFMRETAYNTYRRSSYVLSHVLVAIPSYALFSLAFAAITFWAVGLAGGISEFFFYSLVIFACFWTGSSYVAFISGVVPQVMLGYIIATASLSYYLLFSGFYISRDRIPSYWIWYHFISLVKYPYEAVLQNEFQDPNKCFVRGIEIFDGTPLGQVPAATKLELLKAMSRTLGMNITSATCMTTGADILSNRGVTDLSKWNCVWITFAWGLFFRILFYFSLLLGSKNKRT